MNGTREQPRLQPRRGHGPVGHGRGFERRVARAGTSAAAPGWGRTAGSTPRRLRVMRGVVLVCFCALVLRLVQLQTGAGSSYRALGAVETTVTQVDPAARGAITDRNGAVLAMSRPVDVLVADDLIIHHPRTEATALAPLLGTGVGSLTAMLSRHSGYVVLDGALDPAVGGKIQALGLRGLSVSPSEQRVYPAGNLASPLLGIVNAADQGAAGLEYQYQAILAGHAGAAVEAVSPSGVPIAGTGRTITVARPGTGIELTIDEPLQYVAEKALAAGIASSHAENGIAEVMDPRTGDILAMASMVRDPATGAVTEAPQDLAVTQVYEPGSVFKLVTFSAALQDGIITPDTVVHVPSVLPIDGAIFHDAEPHPAEPLTASQILAQSSNMGTILIAQRLGVQRLAAQIARLGFGKPTGLHFPGASPGLVKPVGLWSPTAIGSTPIGQDTGVTAQQLLDVVSMVANGGVAVPPRLVAATVAPGGALHRIPRQPGRREVAASAAHELATMMESVATPVGTAPAAAVPGYTVAGKTGTSQIPDPATGGYTPGAYWATFAGFAPAQAPALACIVVMTRPTPIYGGSVSAPVFSTIMRYALHRYGVPAPPGSGTQPLPPTAGQQVPAPGVG